HSNASTGVISGTATALGAFLVDVTLSQGTSSLTQEFEWDVLQVGINNPGAQSFQEGDTVSLALVGASASSAALTWSAVGLPDGLSLNTTNGLITGTLTPGTAA